MHGLYIPFSQRHLNIFLGNNQSSERNLTSCSLYFSNSICREKIGQLLGRHVATEKGGGGRVWIPLIRCNGKNVHDIKVDIRINQYAPPPTS